MIIIKSIRHISAIFHLLLLKLIYGKRLLTGKRLSFRKNFNVMIGPEGRITIGDDCFFNNDCSINSLGEVVIGDGTIIGENVKIYDHNHRFNDFSKPIKTQGYSIGKVSIGKHCWIGSNVVILKNAVIGDNCVIGAGCVIDSNIVSESIVKQNDKVSIQKIERLI